MKFTVTALFVCCLVASALATPVPEESPSAPHKHKNLERRLVFDISGDTPSEVQENVRKARQVFEEIVNIDIENFQGGNYGSYGPYGNGGFNNGFGGFGGGFQETDINIDLENYGK